LQKNSNINCTNKNGCTTLHVAVNKQHVNCVKVLLKFKCDVNIQVFGSRKIRYSKLTASVLNTHLNLKDHYGDTALHDIIGKEVGKESKQIIDMLLATPSINLSIRNKRGFNILHYASLKGNAP
jgi:E3 ubiquitin-protein ligase mind-bomb